VGGYPTSARDAFPAILGDLGGVAFCTRPGPKCLQFHHTVATFDPMPYNLLGDLALWFARLRRFAVQIPDLDVYIAYSYLRFSKPDQAEGDSVRRQDTLREDWLKRHPNVRLDDSLKLRDKGVSAFRGANRKDPRHDLAKFLDLVERGRVPPGSYLIVENLDRLTRENPEESIPAVLNLIRAGIRIVQLAPAEAVYEAGMDFGRLMMMLWELARGHGESKRKSGTLGEAWMEKKTEARTDRVPYGKNVPAWIELVGQKKANGRIVEPGTYRVREDAAAAIRLIFKWCAEGLGTVAIAQRLHREKVPTIARGKEWVRSYLLKILTNRAVLGEYQPCLGTRKRTPDGEVVPNYWPAVVTEAEWHAAHNARKARDRRSGRPTRKGDYVYPFSGILRCALDNCPMHVVTKKGIRYIVSSKAAGGLEGSHWRTFPVEPLSRGLLSRMSELRAADLFSDPGASKIAVIEGKIGEVERRLKAATARWEADPESPTWSRLVDAADKEHRALVAELNEARREAANPLSASWAEAVAVDGSQRAG
jgi:DNA invertase Pin-like site-specific DNA recombinase